MMNRSTLAKVKNMGHMVRSKMREVATVSGKSQQEIGVAMGCTPKDARKFVSRLLNLKSSYDPQVSTVVRFALAVGKEPRDFF